uniref:TonB-dependent receptor n=1 Tax=Prevotella sp. GTC17259 TaxID=3236795 RepID=A0AB33J486_9BACT
MKRIQVLSLALLAASSVAANKVGRLDTTTFKLQEVVVSASKWQQSKREQPKRISTINSQQFLFENPQTAADLLDLSGLVYIQKSQLGGGSPMIRGFSTNRLLYSVDGIRMNTAIFRSGNLQNVISLDPFAMERTEVLFGPGSVIYGSDAMGGVMSFTTKNPVFSSKAGRVKVQGSATARYSSANNERTGHFDVSVGGRKWAFLTSFSSFTFDDLKQGSHGPQDYLKPYLVQRHNNKEDIAITNPNPLVQSPSGYSQINLMQKIAFRPSKNWDLQYALHYSETSDYARYDRHTRIKKGLPQYGEWNYGPQVWMLNQFTAQHMARNTFYDRMAVRLAVQRFEESRIDRKFNKNTRNTTKEVVDAYSAGIDFTKNIARHSLYYGIEYVYDDVRSNGLETNVGTNETKQGLARYPQSHWASYAAYLQALFRLSSKLNLEAGLRYNYYDLSADFSNNNLELGFAPKQSNRKGAVSGSLGLTYQPTADWLLSVNAGRGFRTPNVDDMGKLYDSVDGSVVVPNPGLKPEYAHNVELGIVKTFGSFLKLDLSAYYTHLDNALVRRDFTVNGKDHMPYKGEDAKILAIQNAASAYVSGFQLACYATLPMGFGYNMQLNLQHGKEELDNGERSTIRHAAPFFGRAALTYRYNRLSMELYTQFQAKRSYEDMPESEKGKTELYALDSNGHVYAPAWFTLNVKAQYKQGNHFLINAGLENIADRRYRHYSSGISAPGRNFIVSTTYMF